jgi:methanogenic corrinoid protein MtbC1
MEFIGVPRKDYSEAQLGVVSALLEGDASLAFHQVMDLMSAGTPFDEILFDILVPIQTDVGRRWSIGDYGIADEHAVSAALETVVSLLGGSFDQPPEGTHFVVSSAEGDTHALPAKVIAAYLAFRGFRVTNLGATMPAAELGEFLELHKPAALILTCTMAANLVGARRCIAAAHRVGVPVVVGGRGFGADRSRADALGADAWLSNPRLLDGLLERWQPDIDAAEAGAAEIPDLPIAQRWSDVGGVAELVVAGLDTDTAGRAAVRLDVEVFASTMDAALLIDDAEPLIELAQWHLEHNRDGGRPATTRAILGEFQERFADAEPRAAVLAAETTAALE